MHRVRGSWGRVAAVAVVVTSVFVMTYEVRAQRKGGGLNWPIGGNPIVYPFTQTATINSWPVVHTIYDQLVYADPVTFEIKPALASAWKALEQGRVWEFQLRKGVKWHDGQPFTAADVVLTIEATANKDYGAYHQLYFASLEKIEALGENAVRFTFREPRGNLLEILAYTVYVAPRHLFQNLSPKDAAGQIVQRPIGTGPFKFAEYVPGDRYRVVANDDYFGGRPHLDAVTFKVIPDPQAQLAQFLAGAIDWVEVSSDAFPTLRGRPEIQLREVSINRQVIIALNNALPLFSDKRVRRALAMGIDREGVVASLFGGHGRAAVGPIMPVFKWAYPEDVKPLPYDKEQAKRLFQEAGWADTNGDGVVDKDGKPFRFTVLHWPSPYRRILEVAKEQWRQIGVDANVEILEAAATIGKYRSKNYDAALTWWDTPLDPDVSNYYATHGVSNVYNFKNPADSLLLRASQLTDQGQRARLYREVQLLMREEQPAIFVLYPTSLQAHSSRVKGLWPTTTVMMTRNFHQVWKE